MQYLRGQQNNRLNFPALAKRLHFHADLDPALDSGSDNAADQCDAKREHSVSSTVDSRLHSHKDSFSDDSESGREGEEEELCEDFHLRGCCLKGARCAFLHEPRSIAEIRASRKGVFRTQMLQKFPEMIGVAFFQRIPSFLQ